MSTMVVAGIALALLFDFLNGMNDAANSIATAVSTRILSPKWGVLWAAAFNAIGAVGFGVSVATTVGKGIVDPSAISPVVVVAALVGAVLWTWLCTRFGLPISVSHALIGGLCGAAIVKAGFPSLIGSGIGRVAAFIVVSPVAGMLIALVISIAFHWIVRSWSKRRVKAVFSKLQLASAAAYSLSHGTNDAQKTMGIISVLLFTAGLLGDEFRVPGWVIAACTIAIALGTLMGGWKVIRTMGIKITKLRPLDGCAAETAGSVTVIGCSLAGIPVSTTHTITGCIVGVGLVKNVRAVGWAVAAHVVWAWILTIPVSAGVGALAYLAISAVAG